MSGAGVVFAYCLLGSAAMGCTRPAPCSPAMAPPPSPSAAPALPPASPGEAVDPSGEWDVRWDRGFTTWKPTFFTGSLVIRRESGQWAATVTFRESRSSPVFKSLRVEGNRIDIVFQTPANEDGSGQADLEISGWIRDDDRLVGELRWGSTIGWGPFGGHRHRPVSPAGR